MYETDGQIYIRFLSENDDEALEYLYDKYKNGLVLFLYGIVQNMDDAEELMMDTFAVLSSGTVRYKIKDGVSFKTWLYAIAKNQARMFLRKHTHIIEIPDKDYESLSEETSDNHPEQLMLEDERNVQLYRALDTLIPEYKQVIYLTYFEEMKPEEISRIMKKSKKQIYNLTARGKAALKEVLERMGYTWDM